MNRRSLKVLLIGVGGMSKPAAELLLVEEFDVPVTAPVENNGSPKVVLHDAVDTYLAELRDSDAARFNDERRLPFAELVIKAGA